MTRTTPRLVTDQQWQHITPHLPVHTPSPQGGQPRTDDRECAGDTHSHCIDCPFCNAPRFLLILGGLQRSDRHAGHFAIRLALLRQVAGCISSDSHERYGTACVTSSRANPS
jgi:hypothetical protein